MDLGLKGRRICVVGASQGIGAATSRCLAEEGATLVLMARDADALETLAASLPTGAEVISVDLTDSGSVTTAFEKAGILDGCVISAGAAQGGLMWELDDPVWTSAMDLKFMGLVRVLRAVVPGMQQRKAGRVVAVVGNNGRQPAARMLPGSAANAACLALIGGLAQEVAADGVSINALNPGPTLTGRWFRLIEGLAKSAGRPVDQVEAEFMKTMPRGRPATAEEMGKLAAILCSDLADMITGTSLTADGGASKELP